MFRQFINRMIMQYYIFKQNILSKHVNTQFQENVQSTQFTKYPGNFPNTYVYIFGESHFGRQ